MRKWAAVLLLLLVLILVPFLLWEAPLDAFSRELLSFEGRALSFFAVVLLLAIDVALPIPSSFVAAAAVALLGPWLGGVAVWVGLTVAAWVGYALGRFGGMPLVRRLVGERELSRARSMMNRHGAWVLVVCRGAPVLAEASTLFAGAVEQRLTSFGLLTGLGNLGLALAYSVIAWFRIEGALAILVPFGFGIAVPGLGLLFARLLGWRRQQG